MKLHFCSDGNSIVDKVLKYQESRQGEDYLMIYRYYNNFKDKWYTELQDYLDRVTFDADFDYKLCRAIDSFNYEQAIKLCDQKNLNELGAFNRWFYAILRNWKSNVKTGAFRQKKRPSVQCPICDRYVPKIDEFHLQHIIAKSDLPKALSWHSMIYSVVSRPNSHVTCWGKYNRHKLTKINNGDVQGLKRERIEWPWFKDEKKCVVCPYTKKMIPEITNEYLAGLSKKHNRYARPVTWQEFVEEYSSTVLIQAEIYSLDYFSADEDESFINSIAITESKVLSDEKRVPSSYEHVFHIIETCLEDEVDQNIAKLVVLGYEDEDIASALIIEKREVRQRKRDMGSANKLQEKLLEVV